jgi:hypothetical protein
MRARAILLLTAAMAFAMSPLVVPGFGGFEPEQFPIPLTDPAVQPAGYAFSIWGVIYVWLLASTGYGLLRRADDADWDRTRIPLLVSLTVGAAWLPVALTSAIWATVLIWIMWAGAVGALLRSPSRERWWLREAIGLYAGWLTAASAVSLGLIAAGWGAQPLSEEGWAIAALSVGVALAVLVLLRVPSIAYGLAVAWALVAVLVENGTSAVGLFAAAAALVAAGLTVRAVLHARRPAAQNP